MINKKWVLLTGSIGIGIMMLAAVACAPQPAVPTEPISNENAVQEVVQLPELGMNEELNEARDKLEERLIAMEGVVGAAVGASEGVDNLVVFVDRLTPELEEAIPSEFEGYEVRVEVSGPFTAPPAGGIADFPILEPGDSPVVIDDSEMTIPPELGGANETRLDDDFTIIPTNGLDGIGTPEPGDGPVSVDDGIELPAGLDLGEIGNAMNRLAPTLINMEGVSGIAIGDCDGGDCIVVFVDRLTPELEGAIPSEFEGYEVKVEVSGSFTAH